MSDGNVRLRFALGAGASAAYINGLQTAANSDTASTQAAVPDPLMPNMTPGLWSISTNVRTDADVFLATIRDWTTAFASSSSDSSAMSPAMPQSCWLIRRGTRS
jgi:hypothetical protein